MTSIERAVSTLEHKVERQDDKILTVEQRLDKLITASERNERVVTRLIVLVAAMIGVLYGAGAKEIAPQLLAALLGG